MRVRHAGATSRGWAKGRRGSALVELALVTPLFLLLVAGVLDYGFALRTAAAVATAAHAGAQYGSGSASNANNSTGIRAAAQNSEPNLKNMTVTPVVYCQCPGRVAVSCGGSCVTGTMLIYVQVTASTNATTFLRYTGMPFAGTVKAQATMRAQ
jgi:Flp pilus assembly protein TadG